MGKTLLVCAAVSLALLVTAPAAYANPGHHRDHGHSLFGQQRDDSSDDSSDDSGDDSSNSDQPDTVTPSTDNTANTATGVTGGTVRAGAAQSTTISLTGYSFQDNAGSNNATICCGVIHKQAGGTGTYADPITVAVPGSGGQGMETPVGTRAYLPTVHKYVIVEDSGASKEGTRHFDMYVGGQGTSKAASDACMDKITANVPAQLNPPAGLLVHPGAITTSSGCNL